MEFFESGIGLDLYENVLKPAMALLISFVIGQFGVQNNKVSKSNIARNESESLNNASAAKANVIAELSVIVDAAVSTNMALAQELKARSPDGLLNSDQQNELKDGCRQMIYDSLPETLTSSDGKMLQLIGGTMQLDGIINNLIEKYVIEEKSKLAIVEQSKSVGNNPSALG